MKLKKLFLIVSILCLGLALSFGIAACGEGDKNDPNVVPVVSVGLNKTSLELEEGATYILNATILPSNATDKKLTWTSSDKSVATVSDNGKVTAVAVGTATVTATAGSKKAECEVTVKEKSTVTVPVNSISLNKDNINLEVGGYYDLITTILPANATYREVTWTSDSSCVTVSDKGRVTAVSAGTAKVTATADGKSAVCNVTVAEKIEVTEITLKEAAVEMTAGDTKTLTATVNPEGAALSWKSSDESVATVVNGTVTAKKAGEAKITVSAGGKTAECTVTVKAKVIPVTGVTLNKTTTSIMVGSTEVIKAEVTPANATNVKVEWESSDEDVAEVTNGAVLAKAVGTATITATVNGISASCEITVTENTVVAVTGITLNKTELELKEGATFTLIATLAPANATETGIIWTSSDNSVATVEGGLVTAKVEGAAIITAKVGSVTAQCEIAVIKETVDPVIPGDSIITYAHAGEECAAFEWKDTNAAGAKVEYKLSTDSTYTAIDKQLIRKKSADTARADILGLKKDTKYDFKITSSDNKVSYAKEVLISALDRSGYAHHNYTKGVGAYNDDGTLKANAVVIYVTEATKNGIIVNGQTTSTSIANYLKDLSKVKTPVVVRILGTVGAATWKEGKVTYTKTSSNTDSKNNLLPSAIVDMNGNPLEQKNWSQADLISGGHNVLDTSVYSELKGLSSTIKWDSSKNEFDSCWNDCQVKNANNLTIEGVGEDACIFQWGFTFKSSNSVEVRNLKFDDYTEDACSVEGSKDSTTLAGFENKNFWIHHNVFEEGVNYWDVCKEQDKHDGDGSTDFKYIAYVTVSYNVYNGTHKTGLIGGGDTAHSACFTFHHNYYNQCSQRMPLARQANVHVYNNYFYKSGLYSISVRAGAYVFVEKCVFTSGKSTTNPIELVSGSNGTPSCKVIDCQMEGKVSNGVSSSNLYVGNDSTQTVSGTNLYGQNFDTQAGFYTVTNKLDTNKVATEIPKLAGTMKRSSNIQIEGGSGTGDNGDDDNGNNGDTAGKVTMNVKTAMDEGRLQLCEKQNFDNQALVDGVIVLNTTGSNTKVTAHNNTVGGTSFTHRIVIKNPGNYFKITVDKACTIKVYVANGSSNDTTGREVGLYTDAAGKTFAAGTSTTNILGGEGKVVPYSVAAGTYYLESITNELSFYQIEIIYS